MSQFDHLAGLKPKLLNESETLAEGLEGKINRYLKEKGLDRFDWEWRDGELSASDAKTAKRIAKLLKKWPDARGSWRAEGKKLVHSFDESEDLTEAAITCPRCGHYNAMLPDESGKGLSCRDCGYKASYEELKSGGFVKESEDLLDEGMGRKITKRKFGLVAEPDPAFEYLPQMGWQVRSTRPLKGTPAKPPRWIGNITSENRGRYFVAYRFKQFGAKHWEDAGQFVDSIEAAMEYIHKGLTYYDMQEGVEEEGSELHEAKTLDESLVGRKVVGIDGPGQSDINPALRGKIVKIKKDRWGEHAVIKWDDGTTGSHSAYLVTPYKTHGGIGVFLVEEAGPFADLMAGLKKSSKPKISYMTVKGDRLHLSYAAYPAYGPTSMHYGAAWDRSMELESRGDKFYVRRAEDGDEDSVAPQGKTMSARQLLDFMSKEYREGLAKGQAYKKRHEDEWGDEDEIDESVFAIDFGAGKMRPIENLPNLKAGFVYYFGASSSPDMVFVSKVTPTVVEFYRYPYKKPQRDQRPMFDDLARSGTTTAVKRGGHLRKVNRELWSDMAMWLNGEEPGKAMKRDLDQLRAQHEDYGPTALEKMRAIAESGEMDFVDDDLVEVDEARAVVAVYERLNGHNQDRFRDMPAEIMVETAQQLAGGLVEKRHSARHSVEEGYWQSREDMVAQRKFLRDAKDPAKRATLRTMTPGVEFRVSTSEQQRFDGGWGMGAHGRFETMVFKGRTGFSDVDSAWADDPKKALEQHIEMLNKWSRKRSTRPAPGPTEPW